MPVAKEVRSRVAKNTVCEVRDRAYKVRSRECHITHYRLVSGVWTESTGRAFDRKHTHALAVRVVAKHLNLRAKDGTREPLTVCRIEYYGTPAAVGSYLETVPGGERAELTEYGAVREFDF